VIAGPSSRVIGVGLVCLGAVVMLIGLVQHGSVERIPQPPPAGARHRTASLTAVLAVAVYLAAGMR
jgi:hypothetical protein